MADLNIFAIQGRLTMDAEYSTFGQNDTPKVKFSLANNIGYGDYKHANYFNCEYIGKGAGAVHQYLKKGKPINITGEIKQERWETQEGKRSAIKLFVRNLSFISEGNGGHADNSGGNPQNQASPQPSQQNNPFANALKNEGSGSGYGESMNPVDPRSGKFNDDIPFGDGF